MNALKSFIIASLICLPFTQVAWADFTPIAPPASDSTRLAPPNVQTIMPQAKVDPNNCVLSAKISAYVLAGSGGTGGPITENCPTGYVASGMKAFVGLGMSSGRYYWQTNCCKSYVTYAS
jgi:hypothetical protein